MKVLLDEIVIVGMSFSGQAGRVTHIRSVRGGESESLGRDDALGGYDR
jgi:hypothetical protein